MSTTRTIVNGGTALPEKDAHAISNNQQCNWMHVRFQTCTIVNRGTALPEKDAHAISNNVQCNWMHVQFQTRTIVNRGTALPEKDAHAITSTAGTSALVKIEDPLLATSNAGSEPIKNNMCV
jgi:predicted transcriptional regulator